MINNPVLKLNSDSVYGRCLDFNGENNFIECENSNGLNLKNNITISVWVKPTAQNSDYEGIIVKGGVNYGIHLMTGNSTNRSKIGLWARLEETWTYLGYSPTLISNEWNFITWTYDGDNSIFYNSRETLSYPRSGNITYDSNKLRIGMDGPYGSVSFEGLIDDVRIYNTALSSSQIKQNYIAGLNSMLAKGNISKGDYINKIELLGTK